MSDTIPLRIDLAARRALLAEATPEPAKPKRKAKGKSPTARSMEWARAQGYELVERTEHFNAFTKRSHDLFGIFDVLAVSKTEILAIQSTGGDGGHVANRVAKVSESPHFDLLKLHMRIIVQGWRKNAAGKWVSREVEM